MKTFRTEQLRLAGLLLTGNPADGSLWYNQSKLAIGSTAAEESTIVHPGSGLYGLQDQTEDSTVNPTLIYDANNDTMTLASDMEIHVSGRSGISVDPDFLWIDKATRLQGAGGIVNDQLENEHVNVVAGAGLASSASGGKIILGSSATLDVNVDDKTIEVHTNDDLQLKEGVSKLVDGGGSETNTSERAAAGIQEVHLASVDWAKGTEDGGDALAVEHSLSAGDHLSIPAAFDGSADQSMTVGDTVVISGVGFKTDQNGVGWTSQSVGGEKTWEDSAVFERNLKIVGQLEVQGDTIQVDSNQVNIGDNIVVLNADLDPNDAAESGGIDVRIGDLEDINELGGPARIWFNASTSVKAWQAGNVKDWGTGSEDYSDMHTIHTQKYSRTFSIDAVKDSDELEVNFGSILGGAANSYEFPSVPNIVASLTYHGALAEPEQVSWIVKGVAATGCFVDFSYTIPTDDYDLKLYCSTL